MTKNNYIRTAEATRLTGMTAPQIRSLCIDSRIASIKDQSGRLLIDRDSLMLHIKNTHKARGGAYGDIDVAHKKAFYPLRGFDYLYATTDDGKVVNFNNGKELSLRPNPNNGYVQVWLMQNGKDTPKLVHALIIQTQGDNVWNKKEIHHINGKKADNRVSNLLPVTEEEHKFLHRLLKAKQKEEYKEMVRKIKKDNKQDVYQIPSPYLEAEGEWEYWLFLSKEAYQTYQKTGEIPVDGILRERATLKQKKNEKELI